MYNFEIPNEKKSRVIINTDAKNEVDDQFAIVQAMLTQSFDIRGIIPAHFGDSKSKNSQFESRQEVELVLDKMGMKDKVRIADGAKTAMTDMATPVESEGARLIIEEAMNTGDEPLYIAFLGPLTDMASAILMEPEICKKNVKVIWIGGRDYPDGGWEYNLKNDIISANVVLQSDIEVWQIPRNVYRMMPVSFAELYQRVYPHGEIGRYLADNVRLFNNADKSRPTEYRILGDSPAIGVIMFEDCGKWSIQDAPVIGDDMKYIDKVNGRKIRVYEDVDARFILEDLYAKLAQFTD